MIGAILGVPFGLTGLPRQVSILEAAVPTAVMSNIVASRYNSEPNIVAGSVLVTSVLSLITITLLLTLMH
jgi:predicted permease